MEITTNCCGCGACSNACPKGCIEMLLDSDGFLSPMINNDICVNCGVCRAICPSNQSNSSISIPKVIGAFSNDDSIRYQSSSGGVFSVIAENFLRQGGVVCGVEFNSNVQIPRHIMIDKVEDLAKLRGSKYIQSETGNIFINVKQQLSVGRKVLFSGTPCQIAGIRSFLKKDYDNLLCVEVICHGVPSTELWKKHIQTVEKKEKKQVVDVQFRNKKYSWSDFGLNTEYSDSSQKFLFSFEDPFFRMFNSNLCLRKSCYQCNFKGLNTKADISLGDFWNIDEIDSKLDDGKGISIVLLCTDKGKEYFQSISDRLNVCIDNVDYDKACNLNKAIIKSMPESEKRNQFFKDMHYMSFDLLSSKYCPLTLKQKIKGLLLRTGLWKITKILGGGVNNSTYGLLYIMSSKE